MKIYIIDFSTKQNWVPTFSPGVVLRIENQDGAQAYKDVGTWLPDVILMNLETKPSHGLQTASAIHKRKSTAHIPIWFLHVPTSYLEKVEGLGEAMAMDTILQRIASLKKV